MASSAAAEQCSSLPSYQTQMMSRGSFSVCVCSGVCVCEGVARGRQAGRVRVRLGWGGQANANRRGILPADKHTPKITCASMSVCVCVCVRSEEHTSALQTHL